MAAGTFNYIAGCPLSGKPTWRRALDFCVSNILHYEVPASSLAESSSAVAGLLNCEQLAAAATAAPWCQLALRCFHEKEAAGTPHEPISQEQGQQDWLGCWSPASSETCHSRNCFAHVIQTRPTRPRQRASVCHRLPGRLYEIQLCSKK